MSQTDPKQTLKLTIELPEPIFRRLKEMAELTNQSPETLAAQSITGNLPPSVENASLEVQADLLTLQTLPVEELYRIALSQVPLSQQKRHLFLLEKNESGSITSDERQELSDLHQTADRLMVRKAYAWAILRWRGQRVSTLEELSSSYKNLLC